MKKTPPPRPPPPKIVSPPVDMPVPLPRKVSQITFIIFSNVDEWCNVLLLLRSLQIFIE